MRPSPTSAAADFFVNVVDVGGQLVPVVLPAQLDGASCGLRKGQPAARIAATIHALAADLVVARRAAQIARRNLLQLLARVHGRGMTRAGHGVHGLTAGRVAAPGQVLARCCPTMTSHFSQGMSSTSAATRMTSITECVPRLPIPDWMYSLPSGLMREQRVEADRAAHIRADRHADATRLRSASLWAPASVRPSRRARLPDRAPPSRTRWSRDSGVPSLFGAP